MKFKEEILRRYNEAIPHAYNRHEIRAEDFGGLMQFIKERFDFACMKKIIDSSLIKAYEEEFSAHKIYCNESVSEGYLLVCDYAIIDDLYGNCIVNVMGDATVKNIHNNVTVRNVTDRATIQRINDNVTVMNVRGKATIQDIRNNATIWNVRDNATIWNVYDDVIIRSVTDNATIKQVTGHSTIWTVDGVSTIQDVRHHATVRLIAKGATICNVLEYATVQDARGYVDIYNARDNACITTHKPLSSIKCRLYDNAIHRVLESNTIRYANDDIKFENAPAVYRKKLEDAIKYCRRWFRQSRCKETRWKYELRLAELEEKYKQLKQT
jgi:hypothetical protein